MDKVSQMGNNAHIFEYKGYFAKINTFMNKVYFAGYAIKFQVDCNL